MKKNKDGKRQVRQLLTVIMLVCGCRLIAQQPSDRMPAGNVNVTYLEHLVKIGIDSVRKAHGLSPLRNDSILYTAARTHAHYLDSVHQVSHFEKEFPSKYAPIDRVRFHGGADFFVVGENVQQDFAFIPERDKHDPPGTPPHTNSTYEEMAHSMVMGWVHSPPHYKNMLTSSYEFTGLAVAYDAKTNSFYGVQVFGTLPYYKAATGLSATFPYENDAPPQVNSFGQVSREPHSDVHAWKLRMPEDSAVTCPYCRNENFSPGSTKVEVVNGNIIFSTRDVNVIKALIDNRTDGMAAEIVGYKPYDCANPQYYQKPSRRNGQCIFSGRILKPVYRKQLKSGFKGKKRVGLRQRFVSASAAGKEAANKRAKRKAWFDTFEFPFTAELFSISLGKFPKDMETQYYEINIVLIQKKQVCRVLHFTSFCGQDWSVEENYNEPVLLSPDTLAFEGKMLTYTFRIPFAQGKYDYAQKDIQPFLDSLQLTKFRIKGASVKAFASVEGSESINRALQEKRAQSILKAMTFAGDSFASSVTTSENWDLFEKQVQSVPAFSELKGKTHEQVKALLEDSQLVHRVEPWLAKERYAEVTLQLEVFRFPSASCDWIMKQLTAWSDSLIKTKDRHYLDSLDRLQRFYFNAFAAKRVDTVCLRKIRWRTEPVFDTLAYNHAWLKHRAFVNDSAVDAQFYAACKSRVAGNTGAPYWPCVAAMAHQYLLGWEGAELLDNTPPEMILTWIRWLQQNAPDSVKAAARQMELAWYYKSVPWYESKGKKAEAQENTSLAWIAMYWTETGMNDSLALLLSDYLVFHNRAAWGLNVIAPFALKEQPTHQVLMRYLQLTYTHIEEDSSFAAYAAKITWARSYLTHEEWCSLFVGPCRISFQLFDSEEMRDLYCEECAGWKNYGRDPAQWKTK